MDNQFDELHRLVRLEETRTLHLVDLKEAFLTASAAEKIAEINVETERLHEEMANITNQLCILEEAEGGSPAVIAKALVAAPGPSRRVQVSGFFQLGIVLFSFCRVSLNGKQVENVLNATCNSCLPSQQPTS